MQKSFLLALMLGLLASGCRFPNSVAYIDEYFAHLAPKSTDAIRLNFASTEILKDGNPSIKLYASIQKRKPVYVFLSPLLNGELPTLLETYSKLVPITISNSPQVPVSYTRGCTISFNPETALQQAVQKIIESLDKTAPLGSIAIITDFSISDDSQDAISLLVNRLNPAPELLFFSAREDMLAATIQALKVKNISQACIAVSGSKLLVVIDAIETKPEIIAIVQGEPPTGKLGKYNSVNYLFWDMETTLKSIKPEAISRNFVQIQGRWKFLK